MRNIILIFSMFFLLTSAVYAYSANDGKDGAYIIDNKAVEYYAYNVQVKPAPPPPRKDVDRRPAPPPPPRRDVDRRPAPPPPPRIDVDRWPAPPPPPRRDVDRRPAPPPPPRYDVDVRPAPPPPPRY